MEERYNLRELVEKYIHNTCTREEFEHLLFLMQREEYPQELPEEFWRQWKNGHEKKAHQSVNWDANFNAMMEQANAGASVVSMPGRKMPSRRWRWAAACVLAVLATSATYLFVSRHHAGTPADIALGAKPSLKISGVQSNKAVLTLANGSTVVLDSAHNGTLGTQGNTKIIKLDDGRLAYSEDRSSAIDAGYNTIATPRGGKYEIVLPDGTRVWLNAESSLQFPVAFIGDTRKVILNGEGYFEVAKNTAQPFQVIVGNMSIQVLGTHFNVNAYHDEKSMATTLLEGSVKVIQVSESGGGPQTVLLRPGEQSNVTGQGVLTVSDHPNLDEVIAWKNDRFEFNDADISTIMRRIARWYDVEIRYNGSISSRRFTGKFSRNVELRQLIEMLKYTGIDMKIDGNTVVVSGS